MTYLAVVWTLSGLVRLLERRLAIPEERDDAAATGIASSRGRCSRSSSAVAIPWFVHWYETRPAWWDPVLHYMIHTGLKETLRMAVLSVLGATVIGIVLGTLITIRFRPLQWLIRAYIEVWRGLPIVVTIFLIYFALPRLDETIPQIPFSISPLEAFVGGDDRIDPLGQRAGGRGDARRRSSRSRASSTRRRRRSASAGSARTRSSSCRRRRGGCCRR